MRRIAQVSFALFVAALLALGILHLLSPAPATPALRRITRAELAQHARADDCWMAIRGKVYDLTAYLPKHPSAPELLEPWYGKEATEGWLTKGYGQPHSPAAEALLEAYWIGVLAD